MFGGRNMAGIGDSPHTYYNETGDDDAAVIMVSVEGTEYERLWSLRAGVAYQLYVDRAGIRLRERSGGKISNNRGDCSITRISRSLLREFGMRQSVGYAYYYIKVGSRCPFGEGEIKFYCSDVVALAEYVRTRIKSRPHPHHPIPSPRPPRPRSTTDATKEQAFKSNMPKQKSSSQALPPPPSTPPKSRARAWSRVSSQDCSRVRRGRSGGDSFTLPRGVQGQQQQQHQEGGGLIKRAWSKSKLGSLFGRKKESNGAPSPTVADDSGESSTNLYEGDEDDCTRYDNPDNYQHYQPSEDDQESDDGELEPLDSSGPWHTCSQVRGTEYDISEVVPVRRDVEEDESLLGDLSRVRVGEEGADVYTVPMHKGSTKL